MKTARFHFVIIMALGVLLLGACRQFEDILVNVDGEKVSFTLSADELQSDKKFILYDIAVTQEQCQKDCIYWEMIRTVEPVPPLKNHFINFPVLYGQPLADMQVRHNKPLKPGQYSVVATIGVVSNNKMTSSKSAHKLFEIK